MLKHSGEMESPEFSLLSSLRGEFKSEDYVPPHYKEVYRLAIDRLVKDGRDSYQKFLKGEHVGDFLSEDELLFITKNAVQLPPQNNTEEVSGPPDNQSSSGTYWPMHSDVVTPDLDLGWPEVMHETLQTNIDLLFHPPRQNNPTIKEVVRKNIQDARQVIAIVMDVFTDVDIFKETVEASIRGVPVYILLDDFSLKSFLTMAENQDVKLQQLRNMRVRTVKGQNYVCRSGATFHGAMQQRFLLVDCHTAIYGSYSFTWSSEKLNLNMVQVITGHLVKSYDEEFRTLYARSTVPAGLSPPEGLFPCNGLHHQQIFPKTCPKIERRDNLRHSLDTVYRKTCERKLGTRYFEERLLEEDNNTLGPLIENGLPHFQSAEGMNFLKRHSYAGERQDRHIPQVIGPRGSNWNISKDTLTNNYPMDNYLQVPQIYRNQNMRQSYNGNDKQVLSMQQNMSTLENTSKSFMRTLRIESYLKNPDISSGESCDYLDQFEPQDKANSFMQGRMRSSLVFRSTIPEQVEPVHYSSAHWNPAESRPNPNELMLKRQSWQIWDDTGYGPSRNSYQNAYASLGRAKGEQIRNLDILQDTWNKRHSVADPRSNAYAHEDSGQNYLGARMQVNRSTAGNNAQNGVYRSSLNEDQRSVSHYDVKSITDTQSPNSHIWQEPPSRTASAAALDSNDKDMTDKFNRSGSKHFINKSSKKIKSFLNIPDKKGGSVRSVDTISLKSGDSTDTLTAEDEEKTLHGGGQPHQTITSSGRSSAEHQGNRIEDLKSPKPRFRSEENQNPPSFSILKPNMHKKTTRVGLDTGSFNKDRGADGRLYSRFEPFCALEKKHSLRRTQEKTRSLPKGEAATGHNVMHAARGQHENKLEKFFQRVGNFIHKSK